MKTSWIVGAGLAAVAAIAVACSGGATGHLLLGVKDGPPTSSDGRTVSALEIDISRVELRQAESGEAEHGGPRGEDRHGQDASGHSADEVVVFDAGTGAAKTLDLLKVTTFSELVASINVPVGSYSGAELQVTGARVFFADAPTVAVPLVLAGDGRSTREFHFKFKPAVTVNATGSSVAVIDFVPVVVKDPAGTYSLQHDGEHDESGEGHDHHEIEFHGKIATLDAAASKMTLDSAPAIQITYATAKIESHDQPTAALAVGQSVEVEGAFDKTTGALVANEIKIR